MAIARTQAVSANATNVAITSTSNGDTIIVFAYNNASTTIPSLPGGFTNLSTNSATGNACRIGYKVSTGGDTTSGTWTNASNVACHVYSGCNTTTPFLNTTTGAGNGSTLTFTGFAMTNTDGSDWIAGFGGAKACTAGINGNTTNLVNRTNQTIITGKDSGSGETSWSSETLSVTGSGRWLTMTVEIQRGAQTTNSSLTGSLSFAGAENEQTNRGLTGVLSFVGALVASKEFMKALAASISFVGTMGKQINGRAVAILSFIGSATKQINVRAAGAILSFVGLLTPSKEFLQAMTAALSFAGIERGLPIKLFSGSGAFIGSSTIQTNHSDSGSISFSGGLGKAFQWLMTASLAFVGSIIKQIRSIQAAVMGLAGNIGGGGPQEFTQALASAIFFIGTTSVTIGKTLEAMMSSFGSIGRGFGQLLTGLISLIANLISSKGIAPESISINVTREQLIIKTGMNQNPNPTEIKTKMPGDLQI